MELREFAQVLDKSDDPEALGEAIRIAIQALFFHQVIYDDTHSVPSAAVQAIKEHRGFFEKYFAVAGYDLEMDARTQMIALKPQERDKPPYAWRLMRLKKDETLIRIALRYLFEQGFVDGKMDGTGRVETDTVEISETYQRIAKSAPPGENHLVDTLLRDLTRKGVLRIGDKDRETRVTRMTILPGIRVLVSDGYIERLRDWLESEQATPFLEKAS
ncbi:DUF4194 domain-containing protein [Salipiger mucosus]|uniref:DUF4194 domain-containing protein n=1 Tax=Salipiger mucosus DSM 16094 TaxID=1123237 RepID=S9Q9P0_9RHOB|nr:DUF4194 domain-containing protein [Salipiger mucosus]EPX78071.1 hypothetical protein Salmuc_03393 [Salipiger mucosus DSM 16094]